MKKVEPLVSVLIPNFNYAHYLKYCFESVLNQTYTNIEVIFQDNNSKDNSYQIALEYEQRFKEKGIYYSVGRNKRNIGSCKNAGTCLERSEGEYILYLSSDDAIKPTFIEKCIDMMQEYHGVGMVMTHRDEIDEKGKVTKTPSFYNKSCVIPGEEQAAVFMMAGIAVPSQIVYRKSYYEASHNFRVTSFQIAGDWYNNFLMSCCSDIGYIKEPLCEYRVHSGNETAFSEDNMLGIFEHYQLINCFKSTAETIGFKRVEERYEDAIKKLGSMSLRYATKMLRANKIDICKKYLNLAVVFNETISNSEDYLRLKECLNLNKDELEIRLDEIDDLQRKISYDPPIGSENVDS
ncbi:MAG: glycosyltransferase family 2 protein [Cellulosilyticaceae bacterium]